MSKAPKESPAGPKPKKYLILTSSGGGGHISAAKARKQELLTKLATEELKKENKEATKEALKAKQEEIDKRNIIDIVDLMGLDPVRANKDKAWVPTISAFGHELFSGKANTEKWDELQKKGGISSVKELESLVSMQWMAEVIQGPSVYANLKAYLSENDVQEIYNTQALSTPAICQAVVEANTEQGKNLKINSTVTEFLTDRAVHFLDPLSRVKPEHRAVLSVEVTEPPLCAPGQTVEGFKKSHGVDGITFRFLSEEGIEPPVRQEFRTLDFTATPPGPKIVIKAKANNDASKGERPEQAYIANCLKGKGAANNGDDFTIDKGPKDKLVTITMGSQGSATVLSYVDKFIDDAVANPPKEGNVYLCVAAGKNEGDNSLYAQVIKRIEERREELEKAGKKIPDSVTILPLAFQDGKHMASLLQNSDVLITRSGGMSSIEAKYTQAKNPNRRVYVHSEETIATPSTFPSHNYDAMYEGLLSGTVRWEGGNAEYLMKHIKASLGSPQTVSFGFGEKQKDVAKVKSLFHMAYDSELNKNNHEQIKDLIYSGSNPNLKFPGGSSLIDHCKDFETKKLLVEHGAIVTDKAIEGLTPKQIKELRQSQSQFKSNYNKGTSAIDHAFQAAIEKGNLEQVKGLCHNFSAVKDHQNGKISVLEFVIEKNQPKVLQVLLDQGLKIDAGKAYKLLDNKGIEYDEMIKLMVRNQVLHPIDDKMPKMTSKQVEGAIDVMYEAGNKYGNTELHKAVYYKNKGEVAFKEQFGNRTFEQVLNDNVESLNKQNLDGKTPLTITNDRQTRRDLVKLGADLQYLPEGFAKANKEEVRQLSELRVECNELIKDTRSMIIQEYKKHKDDPKGFSEAIVDRIVKLYKDSPEKFTAEQLTKISDYCEDVHKNLAAANKKPEKQTIGTKIVNKIRSIVGTAIFDKFSKDAAAEVSKGLTSVVRNVESGKNITGDLDKSLKTIKEKLAMHKTKAASRTTKNTNSRSTNKGNLAL